jgi:hypothetical protein
MPRLQWIEQSTQPPVPPQPSPPAVSARSTTTIRARADPLETAHTHSSTRAIARCMVLHVRPIPPPQSTVQESNDDSHFPSDRHSAHSITNHFCRHQEADTARTVPRGSGSPSCSAICAAEGGVRRCLLLERGGGVCRDENAVQTV